ncbi:MAG: CocE/NonD family hydrolase [Microbacterium sp.]
MKESPHVPRARTVIRASALVAALTLAVTVLTPTAATAAPDPAIPVVDGKTQPVFDYASSIRERVFIPVEGVDQDLDGVTDVTAIDIIRPAETAGDVKVPAIIDPSPYYTTSGRGNEAQRLTDVDGDGVTDLFPLYYDNYFVPRGYAVIHAQMNGTAFSTGCPLHGGPGDVQSMKVVVDWLNGRVPGKDAAGNAVTASWHTGKSAMIGKSYDGTLANGVAATGVEGLTTIVPIDAISDWYRYSRTNGIRHNTNYPASLANTVTNPDRRALCAPTRTTLNDIDGDETGDMNQFWDERNYLPDVDKVKASVFAVQGLNDDNVRMSQFGEYWAALSERDVPRKVWLPRLGHIDPFDFRRDVWVDTLHRWFDYWLQGVPNGIMSEPQSTVEFGPSEYVDEASWPAPGTEAVDLHLTGSTAGAPGTLGFRAVDGATTLSITGGSNSPSETALATNPDVAQANRLVMLSAPLTQDLRVSGTPIVKLDAALSQDQSNLAALLVDYSQAARTPRSPGDGVQNLTTRTCWGAETATDNACYLEVERRSADTPFWRVSRGVLDSSNREGIAAGQASPVVPNQEYGFDFAMEPYDHVFKAGSRIGVVLTTNLSGYTAGSPNATVTLDAATSTISLPIVGGVAAAAASGGLGAPAPVSLSFDLGGQGTAIASQSVEYGAVPTTPATPVDDDHTFAGWFADAAFTTPFDFAAPLTADATVYAKWDLMPLKPNVVITSGPGGLVPAGATITVTGTAAPGRTGWKEDKPVVYAELQNSAGKKVVGASVPVVNGVFTASFPANTLASGEYTIKVSASSKSQGNHSDKETVTVDSVAPTVTVKTGTGETIGTGGTYSRVSFKLYDAGKIDRLTLNGVAKDLTDNTWSDLNLVRPGVFGGTSGTNTLVVYDVAGNATTVTFTLVTPAV